MADFRQLALQFVLSEDEAEQSTLAKQAASEIQNAASSSQPVARWVESVQPWMPGGHGDEVMDDGDTPNWPARAKALAFLSQTLDFLDKTTLKTSHVQLLVNFFGAMFDIDHKAGIMASANALSRIIEMRAFQPSTADVIIKSVCSLKDDFPRQIAKTRLAVYELTRSLITNDAVAKELQKKDSPACTFMTDLLHLCQNERDPSCLMVWFDTLTFFLRKYTASQEVLEEVYNAFKAYFPITLPRGAQTGFTPDELKLKLRGCFSANGRLASLTFPFLLAKLDQGDSVTVNVKVDVLRTIKSCLEEYEPVKESVSPYVNQIWTSLKYEVRNGEVEDTIWATLETLKTIATRLDADDLRDYALAVTRDCVDDLSNPTYTSAAGRLLVSVMSATPKTFIPMVSPAITHIKDSLRRPKSPSHSQDLLKILHVILETRILLVQVDMPGDVRGDFAAIDTALKTLYEDVYQKPVMAGGQADASYDDVKLAIEAVQGAAALVRQRPAKVAIVGDTVGSERLLPESTCQKICEALMSNLIQSGNSQSRPGNSDELTNETISALQRAVQDYGKAFPPLVEQALTVIEKAENFTTTVSAIHALGPMLGYVGCSGLSSNPSDGLSNFLLVAGRFYTELVSAIEAKADVSLWCAWLGGLQVAIRCFNEAYTELNSTPEANFPSQWSAKIVEKYPTLAQLGSGDSMGKDLAPSRAISPNEAYEDHLFISLFLVQSLYRKATSSAEQSGSTLLRLSSDFTDSNKPAENEYLHGVASLAGFVFHKLSENQQVAIEAHKYAFNLFRDDSLQIPDASSTDLESVTANGSPWDWLLTDRLSVLSYPILEALRPSGIAKLYGNGLAEELLVTSTAVKHTYADPIARAASLSIITVLSNKHSIETTENSMQVIDRQASGIISQIQEGSSQIDIEKAISLFAVAIGMFRRYTGKHAKTLFNLLRESPKAHHPAGHLLARNLELVVAPPTNLTKEYYAVVRPLWLQKTYIELAKPLLEAAATPTGQDAVTTLNLSIGALNIIRHLPFSIYEDDANSVLRIAISVMQKLGVAGGSDFNAGLDVLKEILDQDRDKCQPHIRSIIKISISAFSPTYAVAKPEDLPEDYLDANDTEHRASNAGVALSIVADLPKLFEARHLLPHATSLQKELTLACGNEVRDLRKAARVARAAWADIK